MAANFSKKFKKRNYFAVLLKNRQLQWIRTKLKDINMGKYERQKILLQVGMLDALFLRQSEPLRKKKARTNTWPNRSI